MADKIAPGIIHEAPPREGSVAATLAQAELDEKVDNARQKRDNARWYLVVGVGMMFLGSFYVGIAVGGALMTLYGGGSYLMWSRRLKQLDDPWLDDDIDRWEEEEFEF